MRFLFAVDLTEPPEMVRSVEEIARRAGAELLVLHVHTPAHITPADPMMGTMSGLTAYAEYDPLLQERLEEIEAHHFQRFLEERFSIPVRAALREGDPARVILDDAEEEDVDLIILGKRHHGRIERFLLGSTTTSVVKRTTRPTLLMPIPEE